MAFEKLKNEGNACFKKGQLQEAIELYSKALDVDPQGYVAFSNRSLALYKLDKYERALEDANECVQINPRWAKGHLRKASALIALGQFKEAKEACVVGFSLQDRSLCDVFVEEWLKASKSLVSDQFDHLKKPPWSDVIPEATELFCDEYCDILFTVTYKRLSDADGMSHEVMVKCAQGALAIADKVLAEFQHPATPLLREWMEVATIQFESYPKSKWGQLMEALQQKTGEAARWLKDSVHPSLRKVLDPIIVLTISAMLARGNVLCQAYTGHNATEYLGYACVGFFEQEVFKGPMYVPFHLAVLCLIMNSYHLRGAINDEEVQLIRGICHKIENLLQHLPKNHKNYDALVQHYQHNVKVFREVCAKVISGYTGTFDPTESLSELEVALLECDSDPDKARDMVAKYLADIASKTEASKSDSISHINFIDAENMLFITGILCKLGNHDQALQVFLDGQGMVLSLLATVLQKNILSLGELPATVQTCRQFVLSGAMWLKDKFPDVAADSFIRWKSFFTEVRAVLISLGLRDNYRAAFQAIESRAIMSDDREAEDHMLKSFKARENQITKKYALSVIRALYKQDYKAVAQALEEGDVAIDYILEIYNSEHRNPPQSLACVVVVHAQAPPGVYRIDNDVVYDLLKQWPKATFKHWLMQSEDFERVSKSLSDVLFPEEVKKALLDPVISRVFISPDADLMCFPIDQLPLTDETGSTLPLFERFAISVLSSPRELTRRETIRMVRATTDSCNQGSSTETEAEEDLKLEGDTTGIQTEPEEVQSTENTTTQPENEVAALQNGISNLEVDVRTLECYIVANPDYKHERPIEQKAASSTSWSQWLGAFGSLLIAAEESEAREIRDLEGTQREADELHQLLASCKRLKVHPPLVMKEAVLSSVLNIQSPHLFHLATHGYCFNEGNVPYRGNFWTDQTSGVLLAGAQTFRERKFDKMDVKAGTGHMNAIAVCGMQLEGTRLVFVSACVSSVGPRPVQEMLNSFTQALRAAGAETVVSTLWQVADDEAGEFTHHFYERLVNVPRSRPSEALRHAKVMMKRAGKSMLHWGAYVCHGLDNPFIP